MIAPIIQHDLATRKDLEGLKSYMDDGFEKTNEHIDNLEIAIGKEMKKHKEETTAHFDRSIGVMHEKFQGDLKMVSEYLGSRIDGHDKRFDTLESRFDTLESKFDIMLGILQTK